MFDGIYNTRQPNQIQSVVSLYKGDIEQLIQHIRGANSCTIEIDIDGYVFVHVAGKERLTL